jgi:polyhydroxyalkanoate synthesis regulator phasin
VRTFFRWWKSREEEDFEREMETRLRNVEARGEAAILRVNKELDELRQRVRDLERGTLFEKPKSHG